MKGRSIKKNTISKILSAVPAKISALKSGNDTPPPPSCDVNRLELFPKCCMAKLCPRDWKVKKCIVVCKDLPDHSHGPDHNEPDHSFLTDFCDTEGGAGTDIQPESRCEKFQKLCLFEGDEAKVTYAVIVSRVGARKVCLFVLVEVKNPKQCTFNGKLTIKVCKVGTDPLETREFMRDQTIGPESFQHIEFCVCEEIQSGDNFWELESNYAIQACFKDNTSGNEVCSDIKCKCEFTLEAESCTDGSCSGSGDCVWLVDKTKEVIIPKSPRTPHQPPAPLQARKKLRSGSDGSGDGSDRSDNGSDRSGDSEDDSDASDESNGSPPPPPPDDSESECSDSGDESSIDHDGHDDSGFERLEPKFYFTFSELSNCWESFNLPPTTDNNAIKLCDTTPDANGKFLVVFTDKISPVCEDTSCKKKVINKALLFSGTAEDTTVAPDRCLLDKDVTKLLVKCARIKCRINAKVDCKENWCLCKKARTIKCRDDCPNGDHRDDGNDPNNSHSDSECESESESDHPPSDDCVPKIKYRIVVKKTKSCKCKVFVRVKLFIKCLPPYAKKFNWQVLLGDQCTDDAPIPNDSPNVLCFGTVNSTEFRPTDRKCKFVAKINCCSKINHRNIPEKVTFRLINITKVLFRLASCNVREEDDDTLIKCQTKRLRQKRPTKAQFCEQLTTQTTGTCRPTIQNVSVESGTDAVVTDITNLLNGLVINGDKSCVDITDGFKASFCVVPDPACCGRLKVINKAELNVTTVPHSNHAPRPISNHTSTTHSSLKLRDCPPPARISKMSKPSNVYRGYKSVSSSIPKIVQTKNFNK